MTTYTCTYDPSDDKLRLYASSRLDVDLYAQIKAAGFSWAPKQGLFFATWNPKREDLLLTLVDEIEDEDKTLVERAEERAERFEDYSAARTKDALNAREAVSAIADHIPFGQPLLIGHHSEKRARKHAEQIQNGMKKAVQLWSTAGYWTDRAAGAIRAAKYKELPAVRARRIKTIEADMRKSIRHQEESAQFLQAYSAPDITPEKVRRLAGSSYASFCFTLADYPRDPPASQYEGMMDVANALREGILTTEQAIALVVPGYQRTVEMSQRWIAHYQNRIAYERAMLQESGGLVAENQEIAVGGRVLVRGEWLTVMRLNKRDGRLLSVTTNAKYVRVRPVEEIKGYEAPSAEAAALVVAAVKKSPTCNYPGENFVTITQEQWDKVSKEYKGTKEVAVGEKYAAHRARVVMRCLVENCGDDWNKRHSYPFVYISDAKRKDPAAAAPTDTPRPTIEAPEREFTSVRCVVPNAPSAQALEFQAMEKTLKEGIKTVTAPQLFPTPPDLASRMVEKAGLTLGMRLLEPSAGTARILQALPFVMPFGAKRQTGLDVVAVEINANLANALETSGLASQVICADFLQCNGNLGQFDAICMNPPFENSIDIAHIEHALTMLKPGGRLVAICADGPRQHEKLLPMVQQYGGSWEKLPPNTFKASGTGVNAVLLSLTVD